MRIITRILFVGFFVSTSASAGDGGLKLNCQGNSLVNEGRVYSFNVAANYSFTVARVDLGVREGGSIDLRTFEKGNRHNDEFINITEKISAGVLTVEVRAQDGTDIEFVADTDKIKSLRRSANTATYAVDGFLRWTRPEDAPNQSWGFRFDNSVVGNGCTLTISSPQ